MTVVSLEDYTPSPRFDGTPWLVAHVEEASAGSGPWSRISTVTFDDPDDDPRYPKSRSFTAVGTLEKGWYRVVFEDADGNELQPTAPVQNTAGVSPGLAQVGAILRTRTVTSTGEEVGSFTADTRPTATEAEAMIALATQDVLMSTGGDTPDSVSELAASVVTLRAAMYIEITYYPEQVAKDISPYSQFKALYDENLPKLIKAVQDAEAIEGNLDTTHNAGLPRFNFPTSKSRTKLDGLY